MYELHSSTVGIWTVRQYNKHLSEGTQEFRQIDNAFLDLVNRNKQKSRSLACLPDEERGKEIQFGLSVVPNVSPG